VTGSGWQIRLTPAEGAGEEQSYAIEDNLGYLINRAARLMAQMFSGRLRRHDVAVGKWAVLLFLYARDGLTQRELSRLVAIEPPTLVRTIDRMERDGLVRREPDARDGRATRIRLTPRAVALRGELAVESMAANEYAARHLTPDELETLKSLLRRVIEGLVDDEAQATEFGLR
jgi:DNA-binding MarR family transcriptional regulator